MKDSFKKSNGFTKEIFYGGRRTAKSIGKLNLICYKGKIAIPEALQQSVLSWYHIPLCYPGMTRTEATIKQHLWWPTIQKKVTRLVKKCPICQKEKRHTKKYGLLPEKKLESEPWEIICVDLIGPYTIKRKEKESLTLWCVTMIDPAIGWFEMAEI